MTTVTAGMVKDLREKTGAGMMDCKTALDETKGDIEAAIDLLRKKGLSKAAKKAGRIAADGLDRPRSSRARPALSSKSTRKPTSLPATKNSRTWCDKIASVARLPTATRQSCWPPTYPGTKSTLKPSSRMLLPRSART